MQERRLGRRDEAGIEGGEAAGNAQAGEYIPFYFDQQLKLPKLPIEMGRTAAFAVREQPGCLGEHTDSILATLGYSAQEIQNLKSEQIVLRSDRMLNIEPRDE